MGIIEEIKERSGSLFVILLIVVFAVIPIIRVNISPPVAKMSYYPSMPLVSEVIHFSAEASQATSVESSIKITSREWDFGDGRTGSGVTVDHAYPSAGTYEVVLVVTNERGKSDAVRETVTVELPLAQIKVKVTTSTYLEWSRGTSMLEEDIRSSLRSASIILVPEESGVYDATLMVVYEESDYGEFVDERGMYVGRGTWIQCNIKLYDRRENLLFEKDISGRTRSGIKFFHGPFPDLYGEALGDFRSNVYFAYLGMFIATNFGPSDEFSVLASALKEGEKSVRQSAIDALKEMGARAVEPLADALLKDDEWAIRCEAAEVLGEVGGERAVESLIEALKDEASYVRSAAARALGKIGDNRSIGPLTDLLNDKSDAVRSAAEEALKEIQSK